MQSTSTVTAAMPAVVDKRAAAPWRSVRVAQKTAEVAAMHLTAAPEEPCNAELPGIAGLQRPWRMARVAADKSASARLPEKTLPEHVLDDEVSTTTACSDAEDSISTLSRSSSQSDLAPTISRAAMLLHRARCNQSSTQADKGSGLHCRPLVTSPPGLKPKAAPAVPAAFVPPPGLEMLNGAAVSIPPYTPPQFRKEFMVILKDLAVDRNVARAVRRVRAQGVPRDRQAAEFADAITFIMEETRGAARRSFVALLAGVAYGVFDRKQCIEGLEIFFHTIYPDFQSEVPKLSKMISVELLPTLSSVLTADDLKPFATVVEA